MNSPSNPSLPVIFVLDQSPVVPIVINLMLKRYAGVVTKVVGFTDSQLAARWLTGTMDKQKASNHPLGTPWDHYPPFTSVALAIVESEFGQVRGCKVNDWVCDMLPPATPLVTISSQQIEADQAWLLSVAHLLKPLERHEVITCLLPLLTSSLSTSVVPIVPKLPIRDVPHRVQLQHQIWQVAHSGFQRFHRTKHPSMVTLESREERQSV